MFDLVIHNTSEVVTCQGSPAEPAEGALRAIPRGALGISQGKISFLGPESLLPREQVGAHTRKIDAGGHFVGPGLVDAHTHLVFAGERSREFELRNQGKGYLDIAREGGGIMSTVRATREASEEALVEGALPRLRRLLEQGVTHVEIKSGYGLTVADELKMLRAMARLQGLQPVEIFPTLLCLHAVPTEFKSHPEDYLRLCFEEILPRVAEQRLATFFDAFVEEGAFTPEQVRPHFALAQRLGLWPRLHVEQLTSMGGAELAADVQAVSADHLEQITDEGIQRLAQHQVTAVLAPVSSLFLRLRPFAPGRKLRDAGVNVAIATNTNPGSAMSENIGLALGLSCIENGLTAAEAFWGVTRGGALALRLEHAGKLEEGGPADVIIFGCRSHTHLPYHLGVNHVRHVVKRGQMVFQQEMSCG